MTKAVRLKKVWLRAVLAQKKAYAPYSNYQVGAAFYAGGKIYSAGNIENACYGAGLCAERVALFKARSETLAPIQDLVVVTHSNAGAAPCGLCLQVMAEFCEPSMRIWIAGKSAVYRGFTLKDLLPYSFKGDDLQNRSR